MQDGMSHELGLLGQAAEAVETVIEVLSFACNVDTVGECISG
jgi:hypothetical protein